MTPLLTLVAGPVVAGCLGMLVTLGDQSEPAFCDRVRAENGCEEATLAMLAGHAVGFAVLWLLLWAVPWWRGLRAVRILLALVAVMVLVAAPIRMAG
ncbi:hypothetical protein [Micromonospora auratinigra]|uniref:hypothetical protein n=1 Tax=Micromonospora auratinigra TaxID=261654 RepID=UPI0012FE51EE|nr:hypothetical protein [Micromonospora auratinigra]